VDITNSFDLPFDPRTAWDTLLDIKRIMPCIPGAELLEVSDDGSTYKGKVSVKLGPVALAFVGTAMFAERNEATREARLKCKGNDAKGRGAVQADMTFRVAEEGTGSHVTVLTQVHFTGAVAQYGRGTSVIQGVATQLIAQFAANLRASLAATYGASSDPTRIAAPERVASEAHQPAAGLSRVDGQRQPTSAPQPMSAAKPVSGFALLLKVLRNWLSGLFRERA
jgi:uncharacterized protein